jgi:hypothetical protein
MLNIGTISHGTLLPQDLLKAFSNAYEQYLKDEKDYNPFLKLSADLLASRLVNWDDHEVSDEIRDSVDFTFDTLIGKLEELAARHDCYFGTTEGDGSDFGFWPNVGGEA